MMAFLFTPDEWRSFAEVAFSAIIGAYLLGMVVGCLFIWYTFRARPPLKRKGRRKGRRFR